MTPIADWGEAAMANEEHVKRLKQGISWNEWREKIRLLQPDLSGADLTGANLTDANLTDADLGNADLSNADLSNADLFRANLCNANLTKAHLYQADLCGANLTHANLTRANLSRADLTNAHLNGADLSHAYLGGANLTDAYMTGATLTHGGLLRTIFGGDLSTVIGLETCEHLGPSIIDHRTLQISGILPIRFLRGVGLPDNFINYIPSLFGQGTQYLSCFITYSAKDDDFAKRIHADLQNNGMSCWFAPHDMKIGERMDAIDSAIPLRNKVLLILSEDSIRSDWVEDEVLKAFEEERKRGQTVLFPLRIDDAVMDTNEGWAAKLRAQRTIGDFRYWKDHDDYKKSFDRLLRDLKRAAE